jgi:hypothetical protein
MADVEQIIAAVTGAGRGLARGVTRPPGSVVQAIPAVVEVFP